MKRTPSLIALLVAALAAPACSSSDANIDETHSDGTHDAGADDASVDGDEDDTGTGLTCGPASCEPGFNEENPGYYGSFDIGVMLMMGQRIGIVAAFFQQTAREDYCAEPETSTIPLDTCVLATSEAPTPQCSSNDDCCPEQQCLPRRNDNGSAIPGTEHCQTSRSPIDIGPIEVSGFKDGSVQLKADPSQSNGYVPAGNGTIDASKFAFDTTYTVKGDGDPAQGVSSFEGQVVLGPELELTSPPIEQVDVVMAPGFPAFPLPGLAIDPEGELALAWTGAVENGELEVELSGMEGGTVKCRLKDDGAFTVPADLVKAAGIAESGPNMLTISRISSGTLSGDTFTRHEVHARQTLLINVVPKKAE